MSGLIRRRDDVKVFILFMMNLIDYPVDHNTLHDLCVQDNFVSSFTFNDCIRDLCETGCVDCRMENSDDIYTITKTGLEALAGLEDDIMPLVRDRAMHSAIRLLSFEKSGGKVRVRIEKQEMGYKVHCDIEKKGRSVLSVSVNAPTKALADRIENKVRQRPEEIYRGISALLLDDIALM